MNARWVLLVSVALLVGALLGGASAHYTPKVDDTFAYNESIIVNNGTGDYVGYTDSTAINGSVTVQTVATNENDSASYYNLDIYQSSTGAYNQSTYSGNFWFSAQTFHYTNGTDGQVGYSNPYVWFFMNNSLPVGSTFFALNTQMTVENRSFSFDLNTAAGAYVQTIATVGTGSYQRDDSYGLFTASYTWKMYFDPAAGYIVGYVYTEEDTNSSGDGFTYTDTLDVTHTSYALTPDTAPPPVSTGGSPNSNQAILLVVAVILVVVVIAVIVWAIVRSRRRPSLPRHSATGQVRYAPPPMGPPPPGINLTPSGQPAVQQIIIKETVKVNCRYCGALIDSTAEKCPFCGAART